MGCSRRVTSMTARADGSDDGAFTVDRAGGEPRFGVAAGGVGRPALGAADGSGVAVLSGAGAAITGGEIVTGHSAAGASEPPAVGSAPVSLDRDEESANVMPIAHAAMENAASRRTV